MGVADALRMMNAGLDYLNGPGAGELDAAACGLGAAVAGRDRGEVHRRARRLCWPGLTLLTRMTATGTVPPRRG